MPKIPALEEKGKCCEWHMIYNSREVSCGDNAFRSGRFCARHMEYGIELYAQTTRDLLAQSQTRIREFCFELPYLERDILRKLSDAILRVEEAKALLSQSLMEYKVRILEL